MARQNKSNELAEMLKHQIISGKLQVNEQLEAISKLAKRYGTTVATVSKALSNLEQAGYVERFPGKGVFVKEKQNCRLALVLDSGTFAHDSAHVSSMPILLNELEMKSQAENWTYELFFGVDSRSSAQNFLLKLAQNAFDVVLVGSRWLAENSSEILKDQAVLIIGIFSYKDLDFSISFDSYKMVYEAVLELNSQGCQQIALVESDKDQSWSKFPDCNIKAYYNALKSIGKLRDPDMHLNVTVSQSGGYNAFCKLAKSMVTSPLGIVSVDSLITLGIIQAALSKGFNLGKDVIIATHANQGCGVAQITVPVIKFECSIHTYVERIAEFIKLYNAGENIPQGMDLIIPVRKIFSSNLLKEELLV